MINRMRLSVLLREVANLMALESTDALPGGQVGTMAAARRAWPW